MVEWIVQSLEIRYQKHPVCILIFVSVLCPWLLWIYQALVMTVEYPKMSMKFAADRGSMSTLKNCHVLRQENGIRMKQNQTQIMIYCTFLWFGLQLSSFFESWNLGEDISIIDGNGPYSVWTLCHRSHSCHATLQLFTMSAYEITGRTLTCFGMWSWSYVCWNFYDNFVKNVSGFLFDFTISTNGKLTK